MTKPITTFFSLGSNLGQRINNLQRAISKMNAEIGEVTLISAVYRSKSWGFSGEDFLNVCVGLDTELTPGEILEKIGRIEFSLGRKRSEEIGYQSRNIDIDLLYYGDLVLNSEELTIPHPELERRRFVLKPLADIAPQHYHPRLKRDSRNLLQECPDKGAVHKTDFELFASRESVFGELQFLAIEGNIGVGKTTLAKMIAADFNGKLVLERFADNPFLPKFYEDQGRYAFPLEMSFLADRYQQFSDDTSQFDLFKNFMVSDYDIFKSLIFAQITLSQEEFGLYRKIFNFMYREVRKPDIYLYLYQDTERLLEQIRKRGRDYEQNIKPEYLQKIHQGYSNFLKAYPNQYCAIIDMSTLDFVNNPEDYNNVLDTIQGHILEQKASAAVE